MPKTTKQKSQQLATKLAQRFEREVRWAARAVGAVIERKRPDPAEEYDREFCSFDVSAERHATAVGYLYEGLNVIIGRLAEKGHDLTARIWLEVKVSPVKNDDAELPELPLRRTRSHYRVSLSLIFYQWY